MDCLDLLISIYCEFVFWKINFHLPLFFMQFIKDHSGITTAVLIPIEEWKSITIKHQDLKELENGKLPVSKDKLQPSDFGGTLSPEGYAALNEHLKQARSEWDRNTL